MLKIGDFSKLSRVSIRMLRHYNEIGLLIPVKIDEENGYRYYSAEQLVIVNQISALKSMGFSLTIIQQILVQCKDSDELTQYLLIKQKEIEEQLVATEQQLGRIKQAIEQMKERKDLMKYNVVEKELPNRLVISLREVIPAYEMEGMLWEKMMKVVQEQCLEIAYPCHSMAIFHDREHKEQNMDVEIQMDIKSLGLGTEEVMCKEVASQKIISVTFKGSYDQMGLVTEVMGKWMSQQGIECVGPMFNIYHISPATEENPDNWVTEVCIPIAK